MEKAKTRYVSEFTENCPEVLVLSEQKTPEIVFILSLTAVLRCVSTGVDSWLLESHVKDRHGTHATLYVLLICTPVYRMGAPTGKHVEPEKKINVRMKTAH